MIFNARVKVDVYEIRNKGQSHWFMVMQRNTGDLYRERKNRSEILTFLMITDETSIIN